MNPVQGHVSLKALVVLPTYNEVDNVESIVAAIVAQPGFGVLVVDDDSPDGTAAVAERLARQHPGVVELLHRHQDFGLGNAYREGLALALTREVPLVIQMDADWSHDPKYLQSMVDEASRFDLVIGSRYIDGIGIANWSLWRLILSMSANRYVRIITGLSPRDCTSGFRCWRREALSRVDLRSMTSQGYSFLVELLFAADLAGCRITEVPIVFVERRSGVSKLSWSVLAESIVTPWRLLARRVWRRTGGSLDR